MKTKNTLGKIAIVLAGLFIAVAAIFNLAGMPTIVRNAIYSMGHSQVLLGIFILIRYAITLFSIAIMIMCIFYAISGKKDFIAIIRLCIIYYGIQILDSFLILILFDEGNTFLGFVKDNYHSAIIMLAWIILALGRDKMVNKIIFAVTRIGLAISATSSNTYIILRSYYGDAYDENKLERTLEMVNKLGYVAVGVILIIILVLFICWPVLFEKKSEADPHSLPSSSEEKQQ